MKTAFRHTDCSDCYGLIEEGDPIYFTDDGKICQDCATRDGLVCPKCHSQKKPQYKLCFGCNSSESGQVKRKVKIGTGGGRK